MSAHWKYKPKTGFGRFIHSLEENAIALMLGLMTALTFANVILRYAFNSSIIWSLEVVLILFAWLVLFGISYGFKVTAHLGVDAITNLLPRRGKRSLGIIAGLVTLLYAFLILKGAWDYWAPFADLPKTSGRWFPTGFDTDARTYGYTETGQVPIPFDWLKSWLERTFNSYTEGGEIKTDSYSKLPVLVPYLILPFGALLIFFRIAQAFARVLRGEQDSMIVSHEAEEAVEEVAAMNRD